MKIVPLAHDNVSYVVQLCHELHGLGAFHTIPFDWAYTYNVIINALNDPNYYIRLCSPDGSMFTGFVAGHLQQFVFSPKVMGIEDAWYVRPDSVDRTKMGIALMRGFMKWALDEHDALFVQSGDVANINAAAVYGAYKHIGFKRFGQIYKYTKGDV